MFCWIAGFFVVWGAVMGLLALRELPPPDEEAKEAVTVKMVDARLAASREDVQLFLPFVSSGLSYRERYQPD